MIRLLLNTSMAKTGKHPVNHRGVNLVLTKIALVGLLLIQLTGCGLWETKPQNNSSVPQENNVNSVTSEAEKITGADLSDETKAEVYVLLTSAYMQQNKLDLALKNAEQGLKIKPDYHRANYAMALMQERLGNMAEAEKYLVKALEAYPEYAEASNAYGWILCRQKNFIQAEKFFRQAIANPLYKTPEMAWTNLGICTKLAGNIELAISHLKQAVALNPKYRQATYSLSLLQKSKELDERKKVGDKEKDQTIKSEE